MPRKLDPAWLDAEYNNRALVPDHAEIFARWARDSAQARATQPCSLDLRYGDGPAETLDVFAPGAAQGAAVPGPGGAPILFFIHGGWWRSMDKADHSFVAPAFTREGALVVVPNYALCPTVGIADIALQMTRALAWTWRHAAAHGGDPRRIVVAGHSAGGHLAAMLLCAHWPTVAPDLPVDLVRAALAVSGVFDLRPISRVSFLQPDLRLGAGDVRRLSPVGFPPPAGRLHAAAGALESSEFHRHNRLIRLRWGAQRVPVCETITGRNHFTVIDSLAEPGSRLHALGLQLLRDSGTN